MTRAAIAISKARRAMAGIDVALRCLVAYVGQHALRIVVPK
jgi:hypothetical protein